MRTEIFPAFAEYLQPARFKVAYGGRGSAKTRTFVSILTNNVLFYGWRVVCFREIMESIADSVYQEFVAEIARRDLGKYFSILQTEIRCRATGGVIKFSGIKSNSKRLDSQKLKGFSDFDAAWLEEANPVSAESWNALIPTMRKSGSEIWVSFNPENPLEETYQRFVIKRMYPDYLDGKRYCVINKINYTDNPRFPQELANDLELMRVNDFELYRHIYLGEPVSNSDLSIIKPMWIEAAKDAHKKLGINPIGGRISGFDVADEGADKNAVIMRHGVVVQYAEQWKDIDPNTAARHVFNLALEGRWDTVYYDNIGVGAGAKGALREEVSKLGHRERPAEFIGFTANAGVKNPDGEYKEGKKNKDMFSDIKAQAWWLVADRFKATYDAVNGKAYDPEKIVSIDTSISCLDQLCGELGQPRREFVNGKVKVESKKDMKKRGIPSPNLADAFIMSFAPEGGFDLRALI
jgi:phage terminase large subunit